MIEDFELPDLKIVQRYEDVIRLFMWSRNSGIKIFRKFRKNLEGFEEEKYLKIGGVHGRAFVFRNVDSVGQARRWPIVEKRDIESIKTTPAEFYGPIFLLGRFTTAAFFPSLARHSLERARFLFINPLQTARFAIAKLVRIIPRRIAHRGVISISANALSIALIGSSRRSEARFPGRYFPNQGISMNTQLA